MKHDYTITITKSTKKTLYRVTVGGRTYTFKTSMCKDIIKGYKEYFQSISMGENTNFLLFLNSVGMDCVEVEHEDIVVID